MDGTWWDPIFLSFGEMWAWYLTKAVLFFLAHGLLAIFVARDLLEMSREATALALWKPGDSGTTGCTRVLQQFVQDTTLYGSKGVLLPMTDFSDRLDSQIQGLSDGVQSRVNLFLVIGIAGTFFALFEFASNTELTEVLSKAGSDAGSRLAAILRQALAYAFPVSFFGLAWTLIGQLFAQGGERKLRATVTQATQRAMSVRFESYRSWTSVVEESLKPLHHLNETLTQSLAPVLGQYADEFRSTTQQIMDPLGKLLATLPSMDSTLQEIHESTKTLTEAVNSTGDFLKTSRMFQERLVEKTESVLSAMSAAEAALSHSSAHLNEASGKLLEIPDQLTRTFDRGLQRVAESTHDALQTLLTPASDGLRSAANGVESAAMNLAGLPAQFAQQMKDQMGGVSAAVLAEWKASSAEFFRDFEQKVSGDVSALGKASEKANADLTSASHGLRQVADHAQEALTHSLRTFLERAVETVRPDLEVLRQKAEQVARSIPQAVDELQRFNDEATKSAQAAQVAAQGWVAAGRASHESSQSWQSYQREMARISEGLSSIDVNELRRSIQAFSDAVDRIPRRAPAQPLQKKPGWFAGLFTIRRKTR